MHVAIYLPFLASAALLVLMPAARRWADHAAPAVAAVVLVVGMALLALAGLLGLVLLTAAALAQWPAIAAWGHWPVAPLAFGFPVAGFVGGLAAAALTVVAVRVVTTTVRLRRQYRADAPMGVPYGPQVVVVDDPRPIAEARPARRTRRGVVAVSAAMLDLLEPGERRALLAHERAHLGARHDLFLATAALACAANPLVTVVRSDLAFALERWADETAARAVGSRGTVARAIGRAALAGASTPVATASVAAGAAVGPVPRRVGVLLGVAPGRPWWSWAVVVGVGVVALAAGAAAVHALVDFAEMLELARQGLVGR